MKTGRFNSILNRLPEPDRSFFWLCFLILIKFTLLFFLIDQQRPSTIPESIAVCSGDCDSYLVPIDNLVESGTYKPDYRMPGYGFAYLLFRLILEKDAASDGIILFQTLLDAIATFILALTLYKITKHKLSFYLTLVFYGIGVSVSCYNNWILTESLTASVMVFAFYFFVQHSITKKNHFLLLSGLFFTWAYFLRPVNFPITFILLIMILLFEKKERLKKGFLFFLPVLVFHSLWTIRNYVLKEKLFLLTENPYLAMYKPGTVANWEFCKTFSDFKNTSCFFDSKGLTYFGQSVQTLKPEDIIIPDEIYTDDFNRDSLLILKSYFDEINNPSTNDKRKAELDKLLVVKNKLYEQSIRKNHPFLVYIKTPLLLSKKFVLQSGVHNLYFLPFSYLKLYQKAIKLFYIGIYWIVFILFLIALLFYPASIINNKMILVSYLIAFYIIFIHSIFLRSIEPRYIIPAYPFFVTCGVFFISIMKNNLMIKKHINV